MVSLDIFLTVCIIALAAIGAAYWFWYGWDMARKELEETSDIWREAYSGMSELYENAKKNYFVLLDQLVAEREKSEETQ